MLMDNDNTVATVVNFVQFDFDTFEIIRLLKADFLDHNLRVTPGSYRFNLSRPKSRQTVFENFS